MRAVIISICILSAILIFAVGNTLYTNMKLSELIGLAETVDISNIADTIPIIRAEWEKLCKYLQVTVIDTKIRTVTLTVEHLKEYGAKTSEDIEIMRTDLVLALRDITALERLDLLQIF